MGDLESTADIWRYVLSGGKVCCRAHGPDEYVTCDGEGDLVDELGEPADYTFSYPTEWRVWTPPPEKIPQERWTLLMDRGEERSLEGIYPTEEGARVALASMGRDRENCVAVARVSYEE